ncbi:MAG TPA: head GIN domain-containing protein [Mucilaginibacter sp.]|jgi:hypothetical protein|nr:head GIN domain-containing protein [Mucilaginibacter sp.]
MRSFNKTIMATALLAFAICASAAAAKSSGPDTTVNVQVQGFTSIKVGGPFEVHISQGGTESLKYTAPAYLVKHIIVEVDHGVLKVQRKYDGWGWTIHKWWSDENFWRDQDKVVVYITAQQLSEFTASGSTNAVFEGAVTANSLALRTRGSASIKGQITVKFLEGRVSGSGEIAVSGSADKSAVKVSGSGHFTGKQLVTAESSVLVSGSGQADVNANDKIDATVHGSGVVSYTGQPKTVSRSTSGSGEIKSY